MLQRRLKYTCKYPNCRNGYYQCSGGLYPNKRFHRFPTNPNLLQKWKEICNVNDDAVCTHFYVCGDHFTTKDFTNPLRQRLLPRAVPRTTLEINDTNETVVNACFKSEVCSSKSKRSEVTFCTSDTQIEAETVYPISKCNKNNIGQIEVELLDFESNHNFTTDIPGTGCNEINVKLEHPIDAEDCEVIIDYSDLLHIVDKNFEFLLSPLNFEDLDTDKDDAEMFLIHRCVIVKLAALELELKKERDHLKVLADLCKTGKFRVIHDHIGKLSKSFVDSKVKLRKQSATVWGAQEKVFALSIYKYGPRLYKYISLYFDMPSVGFLKKLWFKMIFEAGINSSILRALKNKAGNMDPLDKYCVLLFDEIQIKSELSYETNQQRVCGYQDLGQLGRSLSVANRALVFMIRGLNTPWKELIAYYFCGQDMSSTHLKKIIIEIILDLQHVGLNVVATVCKQLTKYQEPLRELCDIGSQGSVYFLVGDKPIVTIFNVPDLLKRTRDVFVDYNLQFEVGKMAKFEHIQMLLDLDKKKHFKTLPKLKTEHFNLNDINIKENVEVAAMQFSSTVAAGLETLVLTKYAPHDVTYTAEFVSVMDDLFDSLNGNQLNMLENKKYRGVLMAMSSHMKFWSWLLVHLVNWKVIDKKTGKDETSSFDFIKGWQITIEAVMFLWGNLQGEGFKHLNLRMLNIDPIQNLFNSVTQQNGGEVHFTSLKFKEALKTYILNNYLPSQNLNNSEKCGFSLLCDLAKYFIDDVEDENMEDYQNSDSYLKKYFNKPFDAKCVLEYLLNSFEIDEFCTTCTNSLFIPKENSAASEECNYTVNHSLMLYLDNIQNELYKFLAKQGYMDCLESRFKSFFFQNNVTEFCDVHRIGVTIVDKVVPLLIHMYIMNGNGRELISN